MYTLLQSVDARGPAGEPLPGVWKAFEVAGIQFLRGQLCLVCAGPGTGKSAVVLAYALKSKVPALYLSADSDAFTQATRAASMVTGWDLEKSANAVRSGALGEAAELLADIPIRFNYKASPSLTQIENTIRAYYALYEDYPALLVVDNITNVRTESDDDDPFSGLEPLMDYLHDMARETGAFVIGLHHVTGQYNDGNKPIPLSGIKGQIARVPEMVLTIHRVPGGFDADSLRISPVKNRGGKSDSSGATYADLEFVGDSMQIRDYS